MLCYYFIRNMFWCHIPHILKWSVWYFEVFYITSYFIHIQVPECIYFMHIENKVLEYTYRRKIRYLNSITQHILPKGFFCKLFSEYENFCRLKYQNIYFDSIKLYFIYPTFNEFVPLHSLWIYNIHIII